MPRGHYGACDRGNGENQVIARGTIQKIISLIDYYTVMDREDASTIEKIKELASRMVMLFFKTGLAAFLWEAVSDLITFNPKKIKTISSTFVGYSFCSGIGAGFGVVVGMEIGACATNDNVFSTRNGIQAMQLFFDVLFTDCFWALAFRGAKAMWDSNIAGQIFSGVPLFILGPWFVLVSKIVHKISVSCGVNERDSFNPSFRGLDLSIGVGLAEIGFALAAVISTQKNILGGAIENNFLAGLIDSSLAGVLTGAGSMVPYLVLIAFLLGTLCCSPERQTSAGSRHRLISPAAESQPPSDEAEAEKKSNRCCSLL